MTMTTNRKNNMSRFFKILGIAAALVAGFAQNGRAQDIAVTVTSIQQILPPQVAMYIDNPGKYFNITLSNSTQEAQNVYLAMNLEQTLPASGLQVIVPPKRMPQQPIVVPAGGVHTLTMVEMKTMFNHLPKNEVQMTEGLFDNYMNGTFGLLPEGQYMAQITAYKWDPNLSQPLVLSNPKGGVCNFTVCYKAQAPQWLTPMVQGVDLSAIAKVDVMNPMFTWTPPVVACNPKATQFSYNFKIVEIISNQQPDDAMDKNPVLYQANNLMSPQVIVPINVIKTKFNKISKYAAQVEAVSLNKNTNLLDYVTIENKGKSPYCLFQFVQNNGNEPEDEEEKEEKKGGDDDDDDLSISAGGKGEGDLDSLYVFSNPDITNPFFALGDNHKLFTTEDIPIEWEPSKFMGGEDGSDPDKLTFQYTVNLYKFDDYDDDPKKCGKPIFSKKPDKEENLTINWENIKDKVSKGDHMMLVVQPYCTNQKSIRYEGDDNKLEFHFINHLTFDMFECSSNTVIENEKPTKKTVKELMASKIAIGEYTLTFDEKFGDRIEKVAGTETYKGVGHIEWNPMGFKTMIAVRFDNLKINTADQVYGGECDSYPEQQQANESNYEVVDKLFSEWGIDNLMGDSQIPYTDQAYKMAKGEIKNLAQQLDISKYYQYVKKGKALKDKFLNGPLNDVHLPLAIPKSVNLSPVDLQIVSMKFSPKYATMNIMGVFSLPSSDVIENDVLILGAPRVCISPDNVIPATGYVALLGNFVLKDKDTGYKCTFKAPSDVLMPTDGCFIAWKDNQFGKLTVDIDMEIPKLKKVVNGQVTDEKPILNILWSFYDWDDWLCEDITMDDFEVSGLSGFTFTARDIVLDHSKKDNSAKIKFPDDYDKSWLSPTNDYSEWQGLYCKKIGAFMPKNLKFGNAGNERLEVAIEEMLVDDSGATLTVAVNNIYNGKTGKLGGWSFSLDKLAINFVQSDFRNCYFSGQLGVPLLKTKSGGKAKIDYMCKFLKIREGIGEGQLAYIFKTEIKEGLTLDCFLADLEFTEKQNYILVESLPDNNGDYKTNVELVIGGSMTIKSPKSLGVNFDLGGIHFCGMRVANCPSTWESRYEKDMQDNYKNYKLKGSTFYSGKDIEIVKDMIWFSTGRFSYASDEKKFGPFSFSIENYDFKMLNENGDKKIKFSIAGGIKFIDKLEIGGSAGISILAKVELPKDLSNISDFSLSYDDCQLDKVGILFELAGCKAEGELEWVTNDPDKEGVSGKLTFNILGDFLMDIKANGGYYKNKKDGNNFSYGWFYTKLSSETGIMIPPLQITGGELGFYFNCSKDGESAKPNEGVYGLVVGLGIAAIQKELLEANVTAHVAIDVKHGTLSGISFLGKVKAIGGMMDADCVISFSNEKDHKYLELDVTANLTANTSFIKELAPGLVEELEKIKSKLDSAYDKLKEKCKNLLPGKLQGLFNDGGDDNAKDLPAPKNDTKYDGDEIGFKSGLEANFSLKIEWMKEGKKLNPTQWYVALGRPEDSERCRYTFLKFNVKIVTVDIGASAYLVVGNNLFDNGKLPDIPPILRNFLNGEGASDGVGSLEGADLSKAQRARQNALKEFESQFINNSGGFMFGANLYGFFKVNLGLIKLDAGMTAGLDLCLVKLSDKAYCINLTDKNGKVKVPGWHRYYAMGQLYGYLYACLDIHIDLGFWEKTWTLADARVGAVLQMQGPTPTHFTGEARVKLNLLNGWVDIDKYYYFDCGDLCAVFAGNALDEFKLFGDLSIGHDDEGHGWDFSNRISPKLISKPVLYTYAPLEEPFRIVDPTAVNYLKMKYGGAVDVSALEMEAARTFKFKSGMNSQITIIEFPDSVSAVKRDMLKAKRYDFKVKNMRYKNVIDMLELNPNKYYMMVVTAYAKEIRFGKEIDPEKWNEQERQYVPTSWSAVKYFYFRTKGTSDVLPDRPEDLQDYVAIAFPSKLNQIKSDSRYAKNYYDAHLSDCKRPSISLNTDLSTSAYKNGTLTWNVYNVAKEKLCSRSNHWVKNSSSGTNTVCIMEPSSDLTGFTTEYGQRFYIQLEYNYLDNEYDYADGQFKLVNKIDTLAVLCVTPKDNTWKDYGCEYEKPFTGARVDRYEFRSYRYLSDSQIASRKGTNGTSTLAGIEYNDTRTGFVRLNDPYIYLSYLSNYAFFGGWQMDANRIDAEITTMQSLIYTDKGGVYEGVLSPNENSYNIIKGATDIKNLNIFGKSQWEKYSEYPLPFMTDVKYGYVMQGNPRAAQFHPTDMNRDLYRRFPVDGRAAMVKDYLQDWISPWKAAKSLSPIIQNNLKPMDKAHCESYEHNALWTDYENNYTKMLNDIQSYYDQRRGGYATTISSNVCVQIPYYQFPIVFGATLSNKSTRSKINPWHTIKGLETATKSFSTARAHEDNAEYIYACLYGRDKWMSKTYKWHVGVINHSKTVTGQDYITENNARLTSTESFDYDTTSLGNAFPKASFTIYRCNAFDIVNGCYTTSSSIGTGWGVNYQESFEISQPLTHIE